MGGLKFGYACIVAGAAALSVAGWLLTDAGFAYLANPGAVTGMLSIWVMPVLLWLVAATAALVRRRAARPLAKLVRLVRSQRWWLLRGLLLMGLVVVLGGTFSALKAQIPAIVPFYADPFLADLDRALFLGHDPWRLTHALAGTKATMILDRLYILWFFVMLGTQAWLNFTKDMAFQVRGLLTFMGLWIGLGLIAATAFSSVGPCFYEEFFGDDRFAPLIERLRDNPYPLAALRSMEFLLATKEGGVIGAGISAMPSLHVGMAALLAILLQHRFGNRWPAWLGWAYALAIWFASVHLGFHYVTDGAVSILSAFVLWRASGLIVAAPSMPDRGDRGQALGATRAAV